MSKWIADEIYSEGDDTVIIEFVKYNAARKDSLLGTIPVVQQS